MDGWPDGLDGLDCWLAGRSAGLNGQTRQTGLWDFVRTMGDYCFCAVAILQLVLHGSRLSSYKFKWHLGQMRGFSCHISKILNVGKHSMIVCGFPCI